MKNIKLFLFYLVMQYINVIQGDISKDSSTPQYFSTLYLQFHDGKLEKSVKFWYFFTFLWELRWGYNHWSVINVWISAKILNKKPGYLAWEPECRYFCWEIIFVLRYYKERNENIFDRWTNLGFVHDMRLRYTIDIPFIFVFAEGRGNLIS